MRKILRKEWLKKYDVFWEARTRIFTWYVALSAILVGLSIPVFSKLAITQVDERVKEDLVEEIEVFQQLLHQDTEQELSKVFDRFLQNKIPADKTFLITTIDGEFYRSSPISLPQTLTANSTLIKNLARIKEPVLERELIKDSQVGDILYQAEPINIKGEVAGVLIVANIPDGERKEVIAAIYLVIEVLLIALIIAVIFAWNIAGGVLKPVKTLISTAKTISESDLSQRIPVRGQGEMAELATTFNNMMNRLEIAFNSQRQFLNDASHELRTPITIISGHLELLEYSEPEEIAVTIPIVLDELEIMGRFVEDLLLLAKAEREDFLILKPVDLNELTEEIYHKIQVLGDRNWQLDNQGQGTVILDRQRISQAIVNLAHNAVQHTIITDTITLGSTIENQQIHLWLKDTGEGIPPQDRERIFERFARSSNNQRNSQGTGIGLSIVLAIAKSHNGRVELHSKLGQGSTFTIVLPLVIN